MYFNRGGGRQSPEDEGEKGYKDFGPHVGYRLSQKIYHNGYFMDRILYTGEKKKDALGRRP